MENTNIDVFSVPVQKNTYGEKLFENAVLLSVKRSKFSNTSTVKQSVVDDNVIVQADKHWLRITKKLLDSPELKAIYDAFAGLDKYIQARTLPFPLRAGTYVLPCNNVEDVEMELTRFRDTVLPSLLPPFVAAYPERLKESMDSLNVLAEPDDYPSVEEVVNTFGISWVYMALDVPDKLRSISQEVFNKAIVEQRASVASAAEQIKQALRVEMQGMVEHMVDALSPREDGKKKRIYSSLTNNFREFLDQFTNRNIMDDAELASIAKRASQILDGVDVEELRKNQPVSDVVRTQFDDLKKQLSALVTDAPRRMFVSDNVPDAV